MIILDVTFALVIALVVAAVFTWGLGRPGPWGSFVWFALFLFLATWAVGAWVEPIGPSFWGVAWVPWLVGAVVVALLLVSVHSAGPARADEPEEAEAETMAAVAVGGFFWILILMLILAIGAAYL